MFNLFYSRNFNETQKKVKCRVLINYSEIRDITIQELPQLMDEIENEKHTQYDIPFLPWGRALDQEILRTIISDTDKFTNFLSYLYCLYRKIEIRLEESGYPHILPDLDTEEKSFMKICLNLDKSKEDFKLMNRNDFLRMYPVLKGLFFCYIGYIEYSLEHMTDMDEGDHLPGTADEIKPWLEELNTWSPVKADGK